ncbi:MAG TPA: magnesium transporter CorA family protein [archaeon]|nr:magnesium transporter CorA family protein [archaeon]
MIVAVNLVDNSEKNITISELKKLQMENVWIDVKNPSDAEFKAMFEKLDLSFTLLKPSDLSTMSSIYIMNDKILMYFASIGKEFDRNTVAPITIIFSKNFLVTVRTKEVDAVERAKGRMHKDKTDSPASMAYVILDEITTEYYNYLELIEDKTANMEETVLENSTPENMKQIFNQKADLISFNKLLWYERGVLFSLKKSELPFMTNRVRMLFDDLHDDLTRQIDIVETFREILSDAFTAYLSVASNKINNSIRGLTVVMLYLTIFTTVTSFPNTVATIFGIPIFGNSTDWRIIILLLALSTIIPLVWLLKKRWVKFD